MDFKFANYRFLSESLMLYRDNELIPLKRNQAVLLRYFLSAPDGIHSKDDIIDFVWQGRVVTEQVVFQTISQLRSIVGTNAIQTFSKKGYKWQLPLEILEVTETLELKSLVTTKPIENYSPSTTSSVTSKAQGNKAQGNKIYYAAAVFAVFLFIMFASFNQSDVSETKLSIAVPIAVETLEPLTISFNQSVLVAIANDSRFNSQKVNLVSSIKQYFSAPKYQWLQAGLNPKDWLLWGEVLPSDKGMFFRYTITNETFTWQGYVFSEELVGLEQEFIKRLHQLDDLGVFVSSALPMDLAVLSSIHKKAPTDPEITLLLAKYYINANQTDIGLTYLDKLTKLNSAFAQKPYQAMAYYHTGKVYKQRGHYVLAQGQFDKMAKVLKDTPLTHLQLDIVNANAWLAYAQANSTNMFSVLASGFSILDETNDPLALFELHILYSILAEKTAHHDKKYNHLNEAQALLLQHKLDESNLAIVYYHFALFSQDNNKAKPYLKRILALSRTANNYWVQDQAFELLVQNYIEEGEFLLAHTLFEKQLTSPVKMVLKAGVYQAQQQNDLALPLLKKAFELAQLEYDIYTGLRAALGLYRLTKAIPNTQAKYWAYLEKNAEENWLKQHNVITASE
jgi:DNA-binding winged helix-turn-helix (wHTH) protein/tetratricopeptide (TPR) repeat protein